MLLINKRSTQQQVTVTGASGGGMQTVDDASGEQPARREKLSSDTITLAPFAVSIIRMPAALPATARAFAPPGAEWQN